MQSMSEEDKKGLSPLRDYTINHIILHHMSKYRYLLQGSALALGFRNTLVLRGRKEVSARSFVEKKTGIFSYSSQSSIA